MRRLLPVLVACETVLLAALLWLALMRGTPIAEASPDAGPKPPEVTAADGGPATPALADPERVPVAAASGAAGQPGSGLSVVVHGFITDRAGKPIESSWVTYSRAGSSARLSGSVSRGKPYVIADIAAGRWRLRVSADGHRTVDREVEVAALPRVQRVDHVLEELVVLPVRLLTPEGKPLLRGLPVESRQLSRCLCVVATVDAPPAALPLTASASLSGYGVGQWRGGGFGRQLREQPLAPDIAGLLELNEPLPLYVSLVLRNFVLGSQLVAAGSKEVTFTLPVDRLTGMLGSLRVRVIDAATRAPVKGARVSAHDQQSGSSGIEVDADGVCVLESLPPGLLALDVSTVDYEWLQRWVKIEPGKRFDAGTVELGSPRQIAGRVLGRDGKPVSGMEVRVGCVRLDDYDPKLDFRRFDRTCDAKGEFRLERLGRGHYLVYAVVKSARHDWQVIDTTARDVAGLDLRLGEAHPVTLRCAKRSFEWLRFTVSDDKRQPIGSWCLSASIPLPLELPRGRYVLEVSDDHQRRADVAFQVADGPVEVRYQP